MALVLGVEEFISGGCSICSICSVAMMGMLDGELFPALNSNGVAKRGSFKVHIKPHL